MAYIDTEGTFRAEKIRAIATRFDLDADAVLDNVKPLLLYGHVEQFLMPGRSYNLNNGGAAVESSWHSRSSHLMRLRGVHVQIIHARAYTHEAQTGVC